MNGLDYLILMKVLFWHSGLWSLSKVAAELGISKSQAHHSINRLKQVGLIGSSSEMPNLAHVSELCEHSLPYLYPPKWLEAQLGIPTAHSATPLSDIIASTSIVVWPHKEGVTGNKALEPIHKKVVSASIKDNDVYKALALTDAIRAGGPRDRQEALPLLIEKIKSSQRYA